MSKKKKTEEAVEAIKEVKEEALPETVEAPAPTDEEPEEKREIVLEEAIEAVLFAAGHPISYATLARVFNMTPGQVKDRVYEYATKYNDCAIPRGVTMLTFSDSCQLCTKQYYLPEIREALGIKKNGTLSTSSLEALAIVAYNQPVTRVFVDTLRRADSSYAMNNLLDRGLIECKGRLDVPGRPMIFGTTNDFLRCFGLKSLADLPETSEELTALFGKAKQVEMEIVDPNGEGVEAEAEETVDIDTVGKAPENAEELFEEEPEQVSIGEEATVAPESAPEDEEPEDTPQNDDLADEEPEDNPQNEDE